MKHIDDIKLQNVKDYYFNKIENNSYHKGDYVKMNDKFVTNSIRNINAIILKVLGNNQYYMDMFDSKGKNIETSWYHISNIDRLLTDEEKEELKLKINASKYNL